MNNYDSSLNNLFSISTNAVRSAFWIGIAFIFAVVGGILLYFLFVKSNTKYNSKFLIWLKDFLDFKKLFIENILKITYIMVSLFVVLVSFNFLSNGLVAFLLSLVIGIVISRIVYELILILIIICRNTTEINQKLSNVTINVKKENKKSEDKENNKSENKDKDE